MLRNFARTDHFGRHADTFMFASSQAAKRYDNPTIPATTDQNGTVKINLRKMRSEMKRVGRTKTRNAV